MVTSLAVLSGVVSGVLLGSVMVLAGVGEVSPPLLAQPASRDADRARDSPQGQDLLQFHFRYLLKF